MDTNDVHDRLLQRGLYNDNQGILCASLISSVF